jgi:hypothetical protein
MNKIELENNLRNKWTQVVGIKGLNLDLNNQDLTVELKTRLEAQTDFIPESLYQPIIYQIIVRLKNSELKSHVLISKISVLNSETKEEILKNEKTILSGKYEFALNYDKELNEYSALTKIQVNFFNNYSSLNVLFIIPTGLFVGKYHCSHQMMLIYQY